MGCGASVRNGTTKVHPDAGAATSVVPSASASTSRPLEAAPEVPATTTEPPPQPTNPVQAAPEKVDTKPSPEVLLVDPKPKKKAKSLVKACKDNDMAAIDELLKAGAGLEDLGMWDNTPLLVSCTYGHAEAAMRLIMQKANVRARNEHGASPMHYAAVEGLQGVVEALFEAARADGGDAECSKLVNCGLAKVYNRHLDAYAQRVPLSSAAESGFAEVAGVLLAAGATLEDPDDDGRTALWLAARYARLEVVKLLLKQGAETNVKDSKGVSVLEAAMLGKNSEETVQELLKHGVADVNDTAGSPLRDAVKSGKRALVETLLTHGASVEIRPALDADKQNVMMTQSPLQAACEKGDEYLVTLLVRAGAATSACDAAGNSPTELLKRRGFADSKIVQLLTPPSAAGVAETGATGETGATADVVEATPAVAPDS